MFRLATPEERTAALSYLTGEIRVRQIGPRHMPRPPVYVTMGRGTDTDYAN